MKKKGLRSNTVILYNLDKRVNASYLNIVEAAQNINCSEKTIITAFKTDEIFIKKKIFCKI